MQGVVVFGFVMFVDAVVVLVGGNVVVGVNVSCSLGAGSGLCLLAVPLAGGNDLQPCLGSGFRPLHHRAAGCNICAPPGLGVPEAG